MTTTDANTTTTGDEARVTDLVEGLIADFDPRNTDPFEFRGVQFDRGLAWVGFPEGDGGLGLNPRLQRIVDTRLRGAGTHGPSSGRFFGMFLAAPTIVTHASPELRKKLLRPLFTGEDVWCQLFSEPGAGSDLASLSTRAVRDGDEWVVNGQKVWNTLAHLGDRGMLVTRTDPDVPKHRGLTYFALDMHAPGVDVRPLRQITGEAEFNEVYLTDVRIPDSDRIGDVGDGWRVSMTTLMNERVTIGGGGGGAPSGGPKRASGAIAEAVDLWHRRAEHDPATLDHLMKLWIDEEVLRLTNMRAGANAKSGNPGPEGSIAKLALALNQQRIYELCMNLLGADALAGFDYTFRRPEEISLTAALGEARHMFLRSRANSIEGGTSEIMRNILGERVLGLPGEPRVDKELPWSKVPRS
jgi:alkylation response protein AidB-like acyl-CoA dehydrogenase